MKDVQNERDNRNIAIDQVGVTSIQYPISVLDKKNETQQTVANISMTVQLENKFKGTHMSRFLEVLNLHRGQITIENIPNIIREMQERLESDRAMMDIEFPYFIEKISPVAKAASLFPIDVLFSGFGCTKKDASFILGVRVPVTTLCPCSKEISADGAHNQRSFVTVYLASRKFIWIEDIVNIIENAASCEIYPLLKRSDEKYVTEKAYNSPQFAEDIVRNVTEGMQKDNRLEWFMVETVHLESIHAHNAYARVERFNKRTTALEEHLRFFKGLARNS
ncbi:GTP cyclohydrolase I FolE2 [bacterium]|nr:GTP cyclohydrolase I FolE2 [bacterium]